MCSAASGGTCIRGKGQEEEGQDSLSVWICQRTVHSTSLKKMQLIFVCKPDLKQHPVQGVRRSVRFRKPPLFLPPLLTLAVMPLNEAVPNLIPRVLPQVARAPSGWPLGLRVLLGWVRRNRDAGALDWTPEAPELLRTTLHSAWPSRETLRENARLWRRALN